jgi:glycosyltransferase involved in cell wall biosynthesis
MTDTPRPRPGCPLLTIVIPVYNEAATVGPLIARVLEVPLCMEVVAVDDGSTDGSLDALRRLAADGRIVLVEHGENRGKGAAIRSGLARARGEIVLIQDADLEYDPAQYPQIVQPLLDDPEVLVVYGSRFRGNHHRMSRWHWFGNHFVTAAFNLLYGTGLTDMETCYKAIRREALAGLTLESDRWGFDPEITAKLVRSGCRIVEIPVDYSGRDFSAGKKLRWKDGFAVLGAVVKYRFRS